MPNLKDLRLRIKSIKNTQQTTRAMKMVSVAKLRRAQGAIVDLRPYALKLKGLMENLSASVSDEFSSPYAEARAPKKVLCVVITSNKGLCGAFNSGILKLAHLTIQEQYASQLAAGNLEVIAIGRKAAEFLAKRGYSFALPGNTDLYQGLNFDKVAHVAEFAMKGFLDGTYDHVEIFYNEFKNAAVQERVHETFLPVKLEAAKTTVVDNTDYIFEPNKAEILLELIPKILKIQFYRAVLESHAGEHGARMVSMEKATENAEELVKVLQLNMNKARQAAITNEILEIVSGANAI
jgi:F-type H+-transporting ATPase subunit gamma